MIVVGVEFLLLYRTSYQVIFREIQDKLIAISKTASLLVPYESHEQFTDPVQETGTAYTQAIAPLAAFLTQLPRIRYVYTMKKINSRYYFILDPTPEGDHDGDGVDDKSHIMQEYGDIADETKKIIDDVLATGKARAQDTITTDQWGTFLSSFAPLHTPDGHIYGVIGVDLQLDQLKRDLALFQRPALLSLLAGLLAAVILSALLASYHRKILAKFKQAIEGLSSDKDTDPPFKESDDEFGQIGQTVYHMRDVIFTQKQTLREKIRELEIQSSEIRQAHQRTLHTLDALQSTQSALIQSQKLAALGQLGAGLAHELNSPLAAVLEMSRQLLEETPPDHPDHDLFSQLQLACEHMSRVVKSISSFSRQTTSERALVSVQQAMDNALVLLNHRLKAENVQIQKHFLTRSPIVWGSLAKLQEVFLNLYINACDAMEGNASECDKVLGLTVMLALHDNKYWVSIQISDTGPGISPDIMDQIFNPFFTTKETGKGTGLGLSICYGIIQDHGGSIHVLETDKTRGTTFEVLLPLDSEPAS